MSQQLSSTVTDAPLGVTPVSDAQTNIEERLTHTVMRSFDGCENERLTFVMRALVAHLHGFIRDVRLTEAEWNTAIEFLTEVGHITDDRRQEFILLSDVLGASMQTINVNNVAHGDATEATVFGPFFTENSPRIDNGGDLSGGAAGQPCWVEGTVTDVDGRPIPQRPDRSVGSRRGRLLRRPIHRRPRVWPGPPVQRRRRAVPLLGSHPDPLPDPARWPGRPNARGHRTLPDAGIASALHGDCARHRTLVTHIFVTGDELLNHDTVFGVKDSLITDFTEQPAHTPTPDGR